MALSDEMAYGLSQLINIQGGIISYTSVTTLTGANPAPNPPTIEQVVVNGAVLAGVSAISFRGDVIVGRLLVGDKFQIAGDPTTYTVTSPVTSPVTTMTIGPVSFAPTLVDNAADGAEITFTFSATQANVLALITDFPAHLINGTSVQSKDHRVRMLASTLNATPIIGDEVQLADGLVQKVIRISHMEIQGVHYGWSLQVRA